MDYRKGCLGVVLAGLALVLALGAQQGPAGAGAGQVSQEIRPLVRKDLLDRGEETPSPTLRNIFRPKPSVNRGPARPAPVAKRPAAKAPPPEPSFSLSLNYVGSVQSAGRTMALVVRSGEALPVAEGDEVVPGYRVIRITPTEIEVAGPGGERRIFSRQGDR